MCRTIQSLIQTFICALQMVTRIFMTILLMVENMIRMLLQSIYNFISTMLQIISLIPICCIFMLTARMRCLLCGGGGGGCGGGGGGNGFLGCFLSVLFFMFLFRTLKHYGLADKFLARLGYYKISHEGKVFTPPPDPTTEAPTTATTASSGSVSGPAPAPDPPPAPPAEPSPSGRVGYDVFGDFYNYNTTPLDPYQMAEAYTATEYSKAGKNVSTILYYLF